MSYFRRWSFGWCRQPGQGGEGVQRVVLPFPCRKAHARIFNCYHLLFPASRRDNLFLPLPSVLSPPLDELILRELASEDTRPRLGMSAAPMRSSSRTSSWGEVLWNPGSSISVNLEGMVVNGGRRLLEQ